MLVDSILYLIGKNPEFYGDRDKWSAIIVWMFYQLPPILAAVFFITPWTVLWWKKKKITRQVVVKTTIFSFILGCVGYLAPPYILEFIGGIGLRQLYGTF
ncbi:MAG: hypothetical protein WEC84_04080 [Candidatus Andersenbacteria bacterium]